MIPESPAIAERLKELAQEYWGEDENGECAHKKPEAEQHKLDTLWAENPVECLTRLAAYAYQLGLAAAEARLVTLEREREELKDGPPNPVELLRGDSSLRQLNWDSYGAPSVTNEALDAAARLISRLAAVPTVLGGVQLEVHSDGWDIEIEIGPNGLPESAYVKGPKEGEESQLTEAQDTIARLQQELEEWREALARQKSNGEWETPTEVANSLAASHKTIGRTLRTAEATLRVAEARLREYGQHKRGCAVWICGNCGARGIYFGGKLCCTSCEKFSEQSCTCGFVIEGRTTEPRG